MGYQTGDDRVPGRGRITTLMSPQPEILHSLIFVAFLECHVLINSICQLFFETSSKIKRNLHVVIRSAWSWCYLINLVLVVN